MGAAGGGTWGRGSGKQVPQEGRMGRSHGRGRGWGPAWGSQPGVESQRGRGPWEGSAGEAPLGTHRDQSGLLPSALWRQPHGAQGHHPVPRLPRAVYLNSLNCVWKIMVPEGAGIQVRAKGVPGADTAACPCPSGQVCGGGPQTEKHNRSRLRKDKGWVLARPSGKPEEGGGPGAGV